MNDVVRVVVKMRSGIVKTFPVFPDEKIRSVVLTAVLGIYYEGFGYSEVNLVGVESILIDRKKTGGDSE